METNLLGGDRLLGCLCQLFDRLRIVSQIAFAADKDDRKTLAEMKDLGNPLLISLSAPSPRKWATGSMYLLLNVVE
jgi:hypothetical protein